ncbi:MAG: anti-sigma factor [Rhodobacteraceae bacterium]|nr:anti-sigma factor [Paracoccaceae bacterium]
MTQNPKIEDSMLHAYVDGELDHGAIVEVEAWLRENPADNARVSAWQAQARGLKQTFDPVASEPLPPELAKTLRQHGQSEWRYWGRQAIAASLLLALGGLVSWNFAPKHQQGATGIELVVAQAMSAHSVYSPEVLHPVEVAATKQEHLINWLSKRLGQPLSAPDISATGFMLMGGRLLADNGQPSAQFMYENSDGSRITLYVTVNSTDQETAFKIASANSLKSYYWLDGTLGYAITGEIGQQELLSIAQSAYDQLTIQI